MIHPAYWLRYAKVKRAVKGYPFYDVPNKKAETTLPEAQIQENFRYFMDVRKERLAFFQAWIESNFRMPATLDGDGITSLSDWLIDYSGGLIGDEPKRMAIYFDYDPLWEGDYIGYNVLVDIGIFCGEYLIARRPRLGWEIYRGNKNEEGRIGGHGVGKPIIGGFPKPLLWKYNALHIAYTLAAGSRQRSKTGANPDKERPFSFLSNIKTNLHMANLPDGFGQHTIGDYSDEPL